MVPNFQQVYLAHLLCNAALVSRLIVHIACKQDFRAVTFHKCYYCVYILSVIKNAFFGTLTAVIKGNTEIAHFNGFSVKIRINGRFCFRESVKHLIIDLCVIPATALHNKHIPFIVRAQIRSAHANFGVQYNSIEAADVVGMSVGSQYKIKIHRSVRPTAVIKQIIYHKLFISACIQMRLVGRKIRILRRVNQSKMPVTFKQNAI